MSNDYRGLEGLAADPDLDLASLPVAHRRMIERQRAWAAAVDASGVYRRYRTNELTTRKGWQCPHCDWFWHYTAAAGHHLLTHKVRNQET